MTSQQATERVALAGQRVRLREFTDDDIDGVCSLVGDDRVTWYLSFNSRDRDQARDMLTGILERAQQQPRTEYYLAVTPLDDDQLVGFARLAFAGVQAAKLGYAIAHDHQRRGYATDAVRTMLDFAFGPLGRHRVSAAIGPENAASLAVVERVGFTREGVLRDHVFTNGAWRDSVLFSILADEWTPSAG
ncbi:RimJ/RimL family protein N-acetyltransferase [Saccharomonospora amisosensis]|uniref:RimJ/RimL family protein N-acetyltransferase n=1 Tax=Saccharomonospora amisosensis TaxID=1128677 RepID=A0A7X5ZTE4_9PSEU|nr:GNAT family protein [Saccharomonospora amisosensis]NIJ14516.1 RimJ/RimL family protein N-acetyltransferase [Saccharomonospora amisosensis]